MALGGPETASLPCRLLCPVMLQLARAGWQAEGDGRACQRFYDLDTGRLRPHAEPRAARSTF